MVADSTEVVDAGKLWLSEHRQWLAAHRCRPFLFWMRLSHERPNEIKQKTPLLAKAARNGAPFFGARTSAPVPIPPHSC